MSLRASVAAERLDQAGTSTLTTTGDADVDTEMKVWGCLPWVWSGLVWYALFWYGFVRSGLVWSGLVCFDLV